MRRIESVEGMVGRWWAAGIEVGGGASGLLKRVGSGDR